MEQMGADSLYIPIRIELDYSYSLGELKPYFDALLEGRALASRCPECGRVSFPPRIKCEFDQQQSRWQELTGLGTIRRITVGRAGALAQIAMDGADNLCLGQVECINLKTNDRVRLMSGNRANIRHPAQCAFFQRSE